MKSQPNIASKYSLRRLILVIMAVIACTVLAGFGYYAYLDWADSRALNEYLSQLEQREPNWRERVYGKPLTSIQVQEARQLRELSKLAEADTDAFFIYRGAYLLGMIQNPLESASLFTAEQDQFLQWACKQYQTMLEKSEILESDSIIPYYFDSSLPYDKMQTDAYSLKGQTWTQHELVELQFFLALQKNDPKQAVTSLVRLIKERRRKQLPQMTDQVNIHPGYVERLLNLTEPDDSSLLKLQSAILQYLDESPSQFFLVGSQLRMLSKRLDEMSHADYTPIEITRAGLDWVVEKDSWLRWDLLRPVYTWWANMKIKSHFRRTAHLTLKLYQLSDHVEGLATVPEAKRWPTWKHYATSNGLAFTMAQLMNRKPPASDFLPDGLQYLLFPYLYSVTSIIEKQAMHQAALAAVAAERYRRAHGRFPNNWSELVPVFLPAPLLDPFTGKPMILHTSEQEFLVYSLGSEEIDHEGKQRNTGHHWFAGYGYPRSFLGNLAIQVNEPSQRRLPAIVLKQDAIDELNRWKAYEATKKQKQLEK